MGNLRNVDEAVQAILEQVQLLASETVPLLEARARILANPVVSTADLPPFDNSAMDGFALRASDTLSAGPDNPVTLTVTMDIRAGTVSDGQLQAGQAAQIMTGAPLPEGADSVLRVEDTDADFSTIESYVQRPIRIYRAVQAGQDIRKAGENIRAGETILPPGTLVRPPEMGILASVGHSQVAVIRKPRVIIIGSGDELVAIDAPLTPGKIRDSNSYALHALVSEDGGDAYRLPPAPDSPQAIRQLFNEALEMHPDMIISSAGVSVGAADHVRSILEDMGQVDFWRINMRPGKPLAFGRLKNVPFFGLPGNPVSAMITYMVLVRPALLKQAGRRDTSRTTKAIVGEEMRSDGRRTYARVKLAPQDGELVALATGTQSSGAHMSMVMADGLLIIPENVETVEPGTRLEVKLLRDIATQG